MLLAKNEIGELVYATPGTRAFCPCCNEPAIAKCGYINVWHWAHASQIHCDLWYEGESEWHSGWKRMLPRDQIERAIIKDGERHIADIITKSGVVVELQHSYISPMDIACREDFYGRMVWLFDIGSVQKKGNILFYSKRGKQGGEYWTFRWKWAKKHISYTTKTTYLDIGEDQLFHLKKIHSSGHGWGHFYPKQSFIKRICK